MLNISALGLNRSDLNGLKLLLPKKWPEEIHFVDEPEQADLIFLNLDDPHIQNEWLNRLQDRKVIAFSTLKKEHDLYPIVKRPIKIAELIQVMQSLDRAEPAPEKINHIDAKQFEQQLYLIGGLKMLAAQNDDQWQGLEHMGMRIWRHHKKVYVDANAKTLRSLCVVKNESSYRIHSQKEAPVDLEKYHEWYCADLTWFVAQHCSRGALPTEIYPDQAVHLKCWPDCTQLDSPLEIIAICALLSQKPATPFEIAQQTGFSFNTVSRHLTAMSALSLIDHQGSTHYQPKIKKRSRGMLKSFTHHLAGQIGRLGRLKLRKAS